MTNYSKVKNALQEADEPLTCSKIAEETGLRYKVVNQVLNRHKDKMFKDVDREGGYSVMWQLRKQTV